MKQITMTVTLWYDDTQHTKEAVVEAVQDELLVVGWDNVGVSFVKEEDV